MRDPVQHSEQAEISRSRQQDRTDGTPPPFLTVTKLELVVLQGRSAGPTGQPYELPHQDRFRTDLLDGADLREREKQERILHNLRGQGRTGTLVSDGRKNVAKRPMVNFIFHCTEGVFLIECVDSSDWESEVDVSKGATKGDWLAMKLDKAIGQVNEIAGGEVVDQVLLDSAGDCNTAALVPPGPFAPSQLGLGSHAPKKGNSTGERATEDEGAVDLRAELFESTKWISQGGALFLCNQ